MSLQRFVATPRFDDYRESFKDNYALEHSDDGVILARAQTQGGPAGLDRYNYTP